MGNNVQHAPEKTINGTFGEVWIDDYYAAETTGLEAKVTLEKTEVNQTGSLAKGYKVTGIDCKGTVKMNKVTSFFINLLSENIKAGKTTTCTIISKLEDPDAYGAERVKLTGLMSLHWQTGKQRNWEKKATRSHLQVGSFWTQLR